MEELKKEEESSAARGDGRRDGRGGERRADQGMVDWYSRFEENL